jgi:ABC-2 type transport system ATP-binding protein
LPEEKRKSVIGLREHRAGFEGMVDVAHLGGFPPNVVTEPATLEDIMVHISKEAPK